MRWTNRAVLFVGFVAWGLLATDASAQRAASPTVTVIANAPIYIGPAVSPIPLRVAAPGTVVRFLQQQGDWVQVEFNDPQWGPRIGWVQRALVEIRSPELEPMDLSVKEVAPTTAPPPARRIPQPEAPASRPTAWRQKGWLDVSFEMTIPTEKTFTSIGTGTISQELSTWTIKYDIPTRKGVDVAGGVIFTRGLGAGVAVSYDKSSGYPFLSLTMPHPYYYNASATGTLAGTSALERAETGVHVQAVYCPEIAGPLQVRIYGGPSYFSAKQQMIDNMTFDQVYGVYTTANQVTIKSYTWKSVSTTAWGFNVGGDVAYFFSRNLGLGGFVRYAAASATVPNTAQDIANTGTTQSVKVGGTAFGFGVRTRF